VGRNGPVVDDPSAKRALTLHESDRALSAVNGAHEIDADHPAPLLDGEIFHRNWRRVRPGIVEQKVEPPELPLNRIEQGRDRRRIGDVGRHGECAAAARLDPRCHRVDLAGSAARQRNVETLARQRRRRRGADA
jgi:hypothetical protein